jgi:hypothetical protein
LLFGYFPELKFADGDALGGMVFSCLSHDIIAHETTHALLDGLHRRYQESTNIDVLAFHEAFADIVAIFQHFTLPDVLRFDIARTRGDLARGTFLADLARQFGEAIGRSKALRSAIDVDPTKINYASTTEPHERGSVLVAAVFDAFLIIYQKRVEDLLRIATGGTGVLQPGALHPDLVGRLAIEANKSAAHTLQICIRALDYCPPVDITFPEYLRALITADADLVRKDRFDYRVAFLEAFRARGIYPDEVRTLSVESLQWGSPAVQPAGLSDLLRTMEFGRAGIARHEAYRLSRLNAAKLHEWMREPGHISDKIAEQFGLNRSKRQSPEYDRDPEGRPKFEVHSVRQARRVTPDGQIKSEVVVVLTQRRNLSHQDTGGPQWFRGGATLILDPQHDDEPIRYSIVKSIGSKTREERQRAYQKENLGLSLRSLYFGSSAGEKEPFAMLHIGDA